MKKRKILFHYISFSLFISLAGVIIGGLLAGFYTCPVMMDTLAEWYIVPGLRSAKIRKLLGIQNFWLSIIGILLGNVALNSMINSNGESFDYCLKLAEKDYFIAGFFVLVISVLVSFLFSGRIKKLDMIEVLKGVE